MVTIRGARPQDGPFLVQALALAADWRPGTAARPPADVLAAPDLAHYLPDWSTGGRGVVAEDGAGGAVGAAWWRFFPPDDPGYGFVAPDVPEVTIAVVQAHRGKGVGARLLHALVAQGVGDGLRGLSLSVEPENPAAHLYRRLGFVEVGGYGGAVTMLLPLDGAPPRA